MPYILSVLAAVVYGSADFLGGLASRRTSALTVVTLSQAVGLAVVLAVIPLLPAARLGRNDLLWGAAAGVLGAAGVGLLYRALAIGTMSVVAPLTAVFAAIVPIGAGVARGERPGRLAILGIGLAIGAIVLVSHSPSENEPHPARAASRRSIFIALAAGIVIGLFLVALDGASDAAGMWTLVVARGASMALLLPFALARGLRPAHGAGLPILAGGVLDMGANILYLLAVSTGMLSVVATLVSLYPAATVILARVVYGERLRMLQKFGVVLAILSVVLIARG